MDQSGNVQSFTTKVTKMYMQKATFTKSITVFVFFVFDSLVLRPAAGSKRFDHVTWIRIGISEWRWIIPTAHSLSFWHCDIDLIVTFQICIC